MKALHLTAAIASLFLMCLLGMHTTATGQDPPATADEGSGLLAESIELPEHGVAILRPGGGSDVFGIIRLQQRDSALHLTGKVVGLDPGPHGFHIHEYGDLRDPEGKSAGGHFNPDNKKHGAPTDAEHHAGDLGNIEAGEDGVANVDIKAPWLKLHYVVGRSIVVHQGRDDLKSQPSGDAGDRIALGVIAISGPPTGTQASR